MGARAVFGVLSLLSTGSAVGIVVRTRPMHALLCFVVFVLSTACVYCAHRACFMGLLQSVVQSGSVAVLFAFTAMLTQTMPRRRRRRRFSPNVDAWMPLVLASALVGILSLVSSRAPCVVPTESTLGTRVAGPYFLVVEAASMLLLSGIVVVFCFARHG